MRPLLAIVGALVLAACGDDGSSDPRTSARDRAIAERARAEAAPLRAEVGAAERLLDEQVAGIIEARRQLDAQLTEAELQLAEAATGPQREVAAKRLEQIRQQQRRLQEQLDKLKAGVKLKCPPNEPLC